MNKFFYMLAALPLLVIVAPVLAQPTVQHLRTENRTNPIGLDSRQPRFSWQLEAPGRNELQTAYEIRISTQRNDKALLWNSGKVVSAQSVHIVYSGPPLQSGKRYTWPVRIWHNKDQQPP